MGWPVTNDAAAWDWGVGLSCGLCVQMSEGRNIGLFRS
jgi:hypothetical protein